VAVKFGKLKTIKMDLEMEMDLEMDLQPRTARTSRLQMK
jgi:hypothetical protein